MYFLSFVEIDTLSRNVVIVGFINVGILVDTSIYEKFISSSM